MDWLSLKILHQYLDVIMLGGVVLPLVMYLEVLHVRRQAKVGS